MASKSELRAEFRVITGYSKDTFDDVAFESVLGRAKKHIRSRRDIPDNYDWYADVQSEEALFWYTCLFAKVATGELDSQSIQAGAIDADTLLAKDDDDVTTWYRNAISALRSLQPEDAAGGTRVERENRTYGSDSGGGGGNEISLN